MKVMYRISAVAVMIALTSGCAAMRSREGKLPSKVLESQTTISISKYYGDKKAAVSFTYDDGIIDHYTLIAPHLEANGLRGTFWIIPQGIPEDGGGNRFTWKMARELSQRGHEISNHTWSHRRLTSLSPEEVRHEIEAADDAIEEHTGKRPKTIAFPFNDYDEAVLNIASEGRVGIRLRQTGQGQGRHFNMGNRYATKEGMEQWLRNNIDNGSWGITMTHGIVNGWDQWEFPDVYWDFLKYASDHSDEVWYGTFEDVASYEKERDNCTLETVYRRGRVRIIPHCSLDGTLYTQPLTLKITCGSKTILKDFNPFEGPFSVEL